jgi:SAM-dependent methyltransferase
MWEFREELYGEKIHEVYDRYYSEVSEKALDRLEELARGGRVLELGIGTGRVALPLQERGMEVHGIDASPSMVEKLRSKPGGEAIPVTIDDFAEVEAEGTFNLIYVVFNTFFALLTQEKQCRCFRRVAEKLSPEGIFLVEAFVPDLSRFDRGQRLSVIGIEEEQVRLDAAQHDRLRQQITTQHVMISSEGVELYPVKLRYVWPAEFDLMAALAGLKLVQRWSSWAGGEFTAESGTHISLYASEQD